MNEEMGRENKEKVKKVDKNMVEAPEPRRRNPRKAHEKGFL